MCTKKEKQPQYGSLRLSLLQIFGFRATHDLFEETHIGTDLWRKFSAWENMAGQSGRLSNLLLPYGMQQQHPAAARHLVSISWRGQTINISFLEKRGSAEWLLLLHGLQSDSSLFLPFLDYPAFSKYSILAADFVGFGQSDRPNDFTFDLADQAEIISQLVKVLKVGQVSVVGHSLGGMVATLLLANPEIAIKRIISLEGNLSEADCGESLRVSEQTFEEFNRSYSRTDVLSSVFYKTSLSIVSWSRSGKLLKLFTSATQPKLLVVGGKGKFRSRPSKTAVVTIAEAGHFVLLDQPQATMDAIAQFLQS